MLAPRNTLISHYGIRSHTLKVCSSILDVSYSHTETRVSVNKYLDSNRLKQWCFDCPYAWRISKRFRRKLNGLIGCFDIESNHQATMDHQEGDRHSNDVNKLENLTLANDSESRKILLLLVAKTREEAEKAETAAKQTPPKLPDGHILVFGGISGNFSELNVKKLAFDAGLYLQQLQTRTLGRTLLLSSSLPSTQTLLSQNYRVFPVGTLCVADSQNEGRGRGGNVWESPSGCLMFSITLQESNGRSLPFLQYVVCLAVVTAIEDVTSTRPLVESVAVRIKWPNDLYAGDLKIGGILCTSTYTADEKLFNVVVGCGFNLSNEQPTTCLNALLGAKQTAGTHMEPVSREELLAAIVQQLEDLHEIFARSGFTELQEAYLNRWLHTGQQIELVEGDNQRKVSLTIKGLTQDGYLLAVNEAGEKFELQPDGNSLDFLKGLARRKLAV